MGTLSHITICFAAIALGLLSCALGVAACIYSATISRREEENEG